jgi:hypothetical protein
MITCMLNLFISFITCKWVWIVDWIIGIILVEYALSKNKVLMKVDKERDDKFPAFRRNDTHLWWRPRLYLRNYHVLLI